MANGIGRPWTAFQSLQDKESTFYHKGNDRLDDMNHIQSLQSKETAFVLPSHGQLLSDEGANAIP